MARAALSFLDGECARVTWRRSRRALMTLTTEPPAHCRLVSGHDNNCGLSRLYRPNSAGGRDEIGESSFARRRPKDVDGFGALSFHFGSPFPLVGHERHSLRSRHADA